MFSNYIFFEPGAMGALTLCTIFIYLDAYDFLLRDFSMEIAEVLQKRPTIIVSFFVTMDNGYYNSLLSICQEVLTVSQDTGSLSEAIVRNLWSPFSEWVELVLIGNATTWPLFPNGCGKTMYAFVSHNLLFLIYEIYHNMSLHWIGLHCIATQNFVHWLYPIFKGD